MKRVFIVLVALVAMCGSASAQSLGDFLKGAVTELVDQATGGKATEYMMTGSWGYTAPAVRLESDNQLATIAGNAMVSTIESKLQSAYNFVGIKPDSFSLTLNEEMTFAMVIGKRTLSGTYTYNSDTHALELLFSSKLLKITSLKGFAHMSGDNLDVVFDCTKLVNFLSALGSKMSMLNSITQLVSNYDNVLVGFTFNRE
jgi:hypothetical protein